jgi:hypothetical protein
MSRLPALDGDVEIGQAFSLGAGEPLDPPVDTQEEVPIVGSEIFERRPHVVTIDGERPAGVDVAEVLGVAAKRLFATVADRVDDLRGHLGLVRA